MPYTTTSIRSTTRLSSKTLPPSAGLLPTSTTIIVSTMDPVVVVNVFLLSVLRCRTYRPRLLLETAAPKAVKSDSNDQSHNISGNAQLHLPQIAQRDPVEYPRQQMEADHVRFEMHRAPLIHAPIPPPRLASSAGLLVGRNRLVHVLRRGKRLYYGFEGDKFERRTIYWCRIGASRAPG